MRCAWCREDLPPGMERRVPALVKIPASVALAFMHGGMWVFRELSRPYCAACRRKAAAAALVMAGAVLAAAAAGVSIWLGAPR